MQKIIIIGGGFSGLFAAAQLQSYKRYVDVTLIDKQAHFNFLPMLPDTIGRSINPEILTNSLEDLSGHFGFRFAQEEAVSIDADRKQVITSVKAHSYDYLIIASGTETNFYGNSMIKQYAFTLDNASDAVKIRKGIAANAFSCFLIGGGGYTGIEVATSLRRYLDSVNQDKRVVIIERAPSILGPLPEWMKEYVRKNLVSLRIELMCDRTINLIKDNLVTLSTGESFQNTMLMWAAGVKTSDFLRHLDCEKNPQGRLMVDEYLRARDCVFAIGDAAYVKYQNNYLRMAVQFAIMEGRAVARNIIREIKNQPLKKFKPFDPGYIIPMANNKSCGSVLGLEMKGLAPIILHYIICIYRSFGFKNKLGILRGLMGRGR